MASHHFPGYEYDIFISYRHNDNVYDGWVSEFVEKLSKELVATVKDKLTVFFDENPEDGLIESHQVDHTIISKIKALIFIPIVSQTYCDTKGYAWNNEFLLFNKTCFGGSVWKGNNASEWQCCKPDTSCEDT